jgi:hypothetical protein
MSEILPVENPDYSRLYQTCLEYVEFELKEHYSLEAEDIEHYIFEEALQAVFGQDVFQKIREYWKSKDV